MRRFWLGALEGVERVPSHGPCIVISNHASYLDFLMLSAVFELELGRVLRFWANDKITCHWFFRHYCGPAGCLEVSPSRMRQTWEESLAVLANPDEFLCIFPEGTRTRTGRLLRFKLGYLRLAAESHAPILPVHIRDSFEVWPPHRMLPRLRRVDVQFFSPLRVEGDTSAARLRVLNEQLRCRCYGVS
jgi:1-acyl-sn-glycerol-3-phosphate acyltransferase